MGDERMKKEEKAGENRPDGKEKKDGDVKSQKVEESREETETSVSHGDNVSGNNMDSASAANEFSASEKALGQAEKKGEEFVKEPGIKKPVKKGARRKVNKKPKDNAASQSTEDEGNLLNAEDGEEFDGSDEGFTLAAEDGEELEPTLHAEDGEELDSFLNVKDEEELETMLDAEDAESFETLELEDEEEETKEPGEEMTEEERAEKKRKRRKVLKILVGSVLGTVAAVYVGFSVFFMSHFYFNTTINGVESSLQSVTDVEEYMTRQVEGYSQTGE